MANKEHLQILLQGVKAWNEWRTENLDIIPDLRAASLNDLDLDNINLRMTWLHFTDFSRSKLRNADLRGANLFNTKFNGADLSESLLVGSLLVQTKFENADLSGCSIYGTSAWDVNLTNSIQEDLVLAPHPKYPRRALITVDNLEVAQFVYLLIKNEKIREVINTIGQKTVLILGRFTVKRKSILNCIKDELRQQNYIPIIFDFEKPDNRDLTETLSILAHMSRFIIADITDAKSIPHELQIIVPNLPSVPIQPLIHKSDSEYGMFSHFTRYPWVLPIKRYEKIDDLILALNEDIIQSIESKIARNL